jgi:hypothetical protein
LAIVENMDAVSTGERDARQSQRLESLGSLTATFAHHLNNQLAAVMAAAACMNLPAMDAADRAAAGEDLQTACRRGASLTRALLRFAATTPPVAAPISLADLFSELGVLFDAALPKRAKHRLELVDTGSAFYGDLAQVEWALLSLCLGVVNAVEGPAELSLRGETRLLSTEEAEDVWRLSAGTYVRLSVRVTGKLRDENVATSHTLAHATELSRALATNIAADSGGAVRWQQNAGELPTAIMHLPCMQAGTQAGRLARPK